MNYTIEFDEQDFTKCKKLPSDKNLFFGNIKRNGYIILYISVNEYLENVKNYLTEYLYLRYEEGNINFRYDLFENINIFAYLCFDNKALFISNFRLNLFQFKGNDLIKNISEIGVHEIKYQPGSIIFLYDGFEQKFDSFIHEYNKISGYILFNNLCSYYNNIAVLFEMQENDIIDFDIPSKSGLHIDPAFPYEHSDIFYVRKFISGFGIKTMFIVSVGITEDTVDNVIKIVNGGVIPKITCDIFFIILIFDLKLIVLTNGNVKHFKISNNKNAIITHKNNTSGGVCDSVITYSALLYVNEDVILEIFNLNGDNINTYSVPLIEKGSKNVTKIDYKEINKLVNFYYLNKYYLFKYLLAFFSGAFLVLIIIYASLKNIYSDDNSKTYIIRLLSSYARKLSSDDKSELINIIKNKLAPILKDNFTNENIINILNNSDENINIFDGFNSFTKDLEYAFNNIEKFKTINDEKKTYYTDFVFNFDGNFILYFKKQNKTYCMHEYVFIMLFDIGVSYNDLQLIFFEKYQNITDLIVFSLFSQSEDIILTLTNEKKYVRNILNGESLTILAEQNIENWRQIYETIHENLSYYTPREPTNIDPFLLGDSIYNTY